MCINSTISVMATEDALQHLLGEARYQTYLDAAKGSHQGAAELYEWSVKVAGAWHSHISYVEVAIRNAIDQRLCAWNSAQPRANGGLFGPNWTAEGEAAPLIYGIIGESLSDARSASRKEARRRPHSHPRKNVYPNHDDVVAQLSFGAWSRLVMPPHGRPSSHAHRNQRILWEKCLSGAFPRAKNLRRGTRIRRETNGGNQASAESNRPP